MVTYLPLDVVDARWREHWGDAVPLGHDLKHAFKARWARFYAENLSETHRHLAIVEEMRAGDLFVIAQEFEPGDVVAGWHREVIPDARLWRSLNPGGGGQGSSAWVGPLVQNSLGLVPLLELVEDDATGSVIITDESLNWLYHPYDRGGDLIAPTINCRDDMARRHAAWLSPRLDGL
jgi:hypothetical protein